MKRAFITLFLAFILFGCLSPENTANNPHANETTPGGVRILKNIEYAKVNGKSLLLDLYLPQSDTPSPLIIFVHGGAWARGSKDTCPGEMLAGHGFAAACIDYRLSGEAMFPAQIYDVKAATRWLRANAGEYGIDPGRFGAWGISAGGHLAALLGTSGGIPELEGNEGVTNQSSRVQAVCDYSGPIDFIAVENNTPGDFYTYTTDAANLLGGPISRNHGIATMASPLTYITAEDPPFLIIHGDMDKVVPYNQSVVFYNALVASGVDATFIPAEGKGHDIVPDDPGSSTEVSDTVEFFERTLK